jgi:hypothetical protein
MLSDATALTLGESKCAAQSAHFWGNIYKKKKG